ncbi:MAG: rRNA adenine N-6-methyltransferase family protein [archaeon]
MSDTPSEIRDHSMFISKAYGQVLITGLGLGMVTLAAAKKDSVSHVVVLEKEPHVIALVSQHLPFQEKITVIQADAFTWKKPKDWAKFDCCWHDIWPDICIDNLIGMRKLHRRFGRWCSFQMSWRRSTLEHLAKRAKAEKRYGNYY